MRVPAVLNAARAPSPLTLSDDQKLDWLRLIRSENVGPRTFYALVNRYGGASRALAALPDLARSGGKPGLRVASADDAERELQRGRRAGATLIARGEQNYPGRLRTIADAPPLLWVRGDPEIFARPAIALVGARNASAAGLKMAERLARGLVGAGYVVASGLARGIDAAAHRASLDGGTVAALAGGIERIYPPEHADLAAAIATHGALVSEMPVAWDARGRDFPRRNRLISGLSIGIVVVEAARRSGSLITARLALEQGREVFAVPGSPLDPRAEGTNDLLKQGATLVTTVDDVLEVVAAIRGEPQETLIEEEDAPAPEVSGDERQRLQALLSPVPTTIDDLVRLSGSSAAIVRAVLLELEVAGRIERQTGGAVALL